jgi:hypothetical protein
MSEENQPLPLQPTKPQPVESEDEFEAEIDGAKVRVRKGHTVKQAQRYLERFLGPMKAMRAADFSAMAKFGEFIKQAGKENTGIAITVLAASLAKESIERCDSLSEQIDDPELKVRLEESKRDNVELLIKSGAALMKNDPDKSSGGTVNNPQSLLPPFPANQTVSVMVQTTDKP